MNKAALGLEGELSFEGKCNFYFHSSDRDGFVSPIVLRYVSPEEEPPEYLDGQMGRCRVTFQPLAHPGKTLILQGHVGVSSGDFDLEGPTLRDWLETLFLRHFYPDHTPCEGDHPEDDCPLAAGPVRVTFEPLSE